MSEGGPESLRFEDRDHPIERIELLDLWIGVGLVVLACVLRFWKLSDLGLTHFDEGSYALAGQWLASWAQSGHPVEAGHAPPLFPLLVGFFFTLFGVKDYVATAVSATMGALTVGLLFALARPCFGRLTALLARLLLASSEYHLIYSRLALTDTTFTLLFWAALASLWWALRANSRRWAVVAGLLSGLCWSTKYHGFFPLLIAGAWLWMARLGPVGRPSPPGGWRLILLSTGVALLTHLPWVLTVQWTTGYLPVLQGQLDHTVNLSRWVVTSPLGLGFFLWKWVTAPVLMATLVGLVVAFRRRSGPALFVLWGGSSIFLACLFYLSFPRLLLPAIPAICLLAALGWTWLSWRIWRPWGRIVAVGGGVVLVLWNLGATLPVLGTATTGYRDLAAQLERAREPVLTQLNKCYYFYSGAGSLELRKQDPHVLERVVSNHQCLLVAVDPIIYRLPAVRAWLKTYQRELALLHEHELELFEPLYFQGFDPGPDWEALPPSVAPFTPSRSKAYVLQLSRGGKQPDPRLAELFR